MSILVTGRAGYIGSHTVQALADAGQKVLVIDDLSAGFADLLAPDIALVVGDAGNEALVERTIGRNGCCRVTRDFPRGETAHFHPVAHVGGRRFQREDDKIRD